MKRDRPDLRGLLRAQEAASRRKRDDADFAERIMSADRASLLTECELIGLAPDGRPDHELIRALIAWHRRQAIKR